MSPDHNQENGTPAGTPVNRKDGPGPPSPGEARILDQVRYVDLYCPVEVREVSIYLQESPHPEYCRFKFYNLSKEKVASLKVLVYAAGLQGHGEEGSPGQLVGAVVRQEVGPGGWGSSDKIFFPQDFPVREVDLVVIEVAFAGGTTWGKGDYDLQEVRLDHIEDPEELARLQKVAGRDALFYGRKNEDSWTCVCGRYNLLEEDNCLRCQRSKFYVFEDFSSGDYIRKALQKRAGRQALEEEKKKEAHRRTRVRLAGLLVLLLALGLAWAGHVTRGTFSYQEYRLQVLNQPDDRGRTPLVRAIQQGEVAEALDLIAAGVDLGTRDPQGNTPLHWAVIQGQLEITRRLLEGGARDIQNSFGDTALLWAVIREKEGMTRLLLEGGAPADQGDREGYTPLHWAASGGNQEIVALLLEGGAGVNRPTPDNQTALHLASSGGHGEIVQVLLGKGALVDQVGDDGYTPLHWAVTWGHGEVVDLLLAGGSDPAIPAPGGLDARGLAELWGHREIAERLPPPR